MVEMSWQDVLEATGYLSEQQALTYFDLRLQDIDLPDQVFLWHSALWTRSQFQKGAHLQHRDLVTETFIRLRPLVSRWQTAGTLYGLCPDAIIHAGRSPLPVLVEVDTGKETAKQWASKLAVYRLEGFANAQFSLWVIAAGGPRRISRLTAWVGETHLPVPWRVSPVDRLTRDFAQGFPLPAPPSEDDDQANVPRRVPRYRLWPGGRVLSPTEAESLIRQGARIGAREITAQGPVYYLAADSVHRPPQ